MLRITIENHPMTKCFIIEGRLEGAHVTELENCWQTTISTESDHSLLVDLTDTTFVDACGKQLLTRMRQGGARLLASGVMTKKIVEEIEKSE
jgi:anti-anti-sigma regulatory factor